MTDYDYIEMMKHAGWITNGDVERVHDTIEMAYVSALKEAYNEEDGMYDTYVYVVKYYPAEDHEEQHHLNNIARIFSEMKREMYVVAIGGDSDGCTFSTTSYLLTSRGVKMLKKYGVNVDKRSIHEPSPTCRSLIVKERDFGNYNWHIYIEGMSYSYDYSVNGYNSVDEARKAGVLRLMTLDKHGVIKLTA